MIQYNDKTLVFPEHIRGDSFANRTFTVNVLEMGSFGDGVSAAIDDALERVKSLASGDGGDTEAAADDVIANIEANYNKMVKSSTIYTIVLPLPNSFTDAQSHSWNTEKGLLGAAAEAAEGAGLGGLAPKFLADKISAWGSEVLPGAVSAGTGAIASYNIGTAIGNLSNQANLRKPLIDPGYFQNYTGSEPREFSFSWDLIPRNEREAQTMVNLVLKLKEFSSPEMAKGGVSLLAPHFFDIELGNRFISGMANLRGVVLKSMTIDYGADGYMQQYANGMPKYMKLDLTFAERSMMTANHYRKNL